MRTVLLGVGLLALATGAAPAQVFEASVDGGQTIVKNGRLGVFNIGDPQYEMKDGFRLGARLTFNTHNFFGHEFGYSYSRTKLGFEGFDSSNDFGMTTHKVFYNFLAYMTPEGSIIRPFVAGGGGFSSFYPPGTSVSFNNGITKPSVNYGAGFKVRVSPIFLIRFDVRDFITSKPLDLIDRSGALHQIEASAGFSLIL